MHGLGMSIASLERSALVQEEIFILCSLNNLLVAADLPSGKKVSLQQTSVSGPWKSIFALKRVTLVYNQFLKNFEHLYSAKCPCHVSILVRVKLGAAKLRTGPSDLVAPRGHLLKRSKNNLCVLLLWHVLYVHCLLLAPTSIQNIPQNGMTQSASPQMVCHQFTVRYIQKCRLNRQNPLEKFNREIDFH